MEIKLCNPTYAYERANNVKNTTTTKWSKILVKDKPEAYIKNAQILVLLKKKEMLEEIETKIQLSNNEKRKTQFLTIE